MSRATNQPELASQAMQDESAGKVSSVHGSRPNTLALVQKAPKRMLSCNLLRSKAAAHDDHRTARRKPFVESSFDVLARPYRDSRKSLRTRSDLELTLLARLPYLVAANATSDYGTLAAASTGLDLVTIRSGVHGGVIREGWVLTSSQSLNEEHIVAKLAVAHAYCEAAGFSFNVFTGDAQ